MSRLDEALLRLDIAIADLEGALADAGPTEIVDEATEVLPELRSERDQLADEVRALRARAAEDAELRAEAAVAVREALNDLRGAVRQGDPSHA
ncbi:MAG: hypothetical protein AAF479_01935 [Pseudomonadota bacterium]